MTETQIPRMKLLRLSHNLTQTQFAKLIGYSRSIVQAWENGRRECHEDTYYYAKMKLGE